LTLAGFDEAAVLPLHEQLAGDARRAANEDIIQTVAVHVSHRERWGLAGKLVR